ncbi:MAG TPA: cellulase N-terminal Ig-like domain-containing protein [Candidatus Hydrogenedens sp.]|nr:cellulase N-terminal Ig-like domain-containing protein [Candidatus Hydrogenedens sp.]
MKLFYLLNKLVNILLTALLIIFLTTTFAISEEVSQPNSEGEDYIWETIPLLYNGGFEPLDSKEENTAELGGWNISPESPDNKTQLDNEVFLAGKSSLRVEGKGSITVSTDDIPLPKGMVSVTGSISYRGSFSSKAAIQWVKENQPIDGKELKFVESTNSEWKRFVLSETQVPQGATAIRFQLTSELTPSGTVWWDEANFTGIVEQPKLVEIFVNQVGYDLLYPKACILVANFKPEEIKAYLLDNSDNEVKTIAFREPKRIFGAHKSDWGKWYYRGNFTDYDVEGNYRITVLVDGKRYYSPSFMIGKDLLWEKTIPKVLEGLRLHRCGTAVEGIHDLCHADDSYNGKSLIGAWHDGETYSKTKSAICLNYLVEGYNICRWRLLKNPELSSQFQDEVLWGVKYIANRVKEDGTLLGNVISKTTTEPKKPEQETDNQISTGDERTITESTNDEDAVISALGYTAYMTTWFGSENPYIDLTDKVAKSMLEHGKRAPGLFTALTFLGEIKETDTSIIQSIIPDNLLPVCESITRYDSLTYEGKTFQLVQALKDAVQFYTEQVNENPFGICPMKKGSEPDYFGITLNEEEQLRGTNIHILQVAQLAGKAFRFLPDDTTKKLFFDHINWILGVNPYGICFIEGLGTKNLPAYAHPYIKAGLSPRKLVGVIPYGIRGQSHNSDTPYLDLSTSSEPEVNSTGISIETMALYINTLAQFYRVRVHAETPSMPPLPN